LRFPNRVEKPLEERAGLESRRDQDVAGNQRRRVQLLRRRLAEYAVAKLDRREALSTCQRDGAVEGEQLADAGVNE
jgi:hypothetical protein